MADQIDSAEASDQHRTGQVCRLNLDCSDILMSFDRHRVDILSSETQVIAEFRQQNKSVTWCCVCSSATQSGVARGRGPRFHQLHLLFDKNYEQQNELVDEIAERIQARRAVRLAMPHYAADDHGNPPGPFR